MSDNEIDPRDKPDNVFIPKHETKSRRHLHSFKNSIKTDED